MDQRGGGVQEAGDGLNYLALCLTVGCTGLLWARCVGRTTQWCFRVHRPIQPANKVPDRQQGMRLVEEVVVEIRSLWLNMLDGH